MGVFRISWVFNKSCFASVSDLDQGKFQKNQNTLEQHYDTNLAPWGRWVLWCAIWGIWHFYQFFLYVLFLSTWLTWTVNNTCHQLVKSVMYKYCCGFTPFTILTCVCLWHRSGFEFLIHKVEIMTRTGPSAKMRSSYHISGCVSESILSHTALVKPLHFANCKVKTTVRERAFFISRMLAFGDFEAKCLRLLLKKQKKGTSGHDGWPF